MPPRFKASDESLNRKGFWVLSKGIKLPKTGIVPVFYNHETNTRLPIGKAENFKYEEDGSLTCDIIFDMQDKFAQEVALKVDGGFVNSCSMGIVVTETSKAKKFLKLNQLKHTVISCFLYELSITPIPANENAVKLRADEADSLEASFELPDINYNPKMETLKELLKARGIALQTLGLADDASEEAIMAAIQKLAAQKAPEEVPLTTEEKLADKVIAYGKMIGVVNDENEPHYKKLALADSESTMGILSLSVDGKKGKNTEPVKDTDKDVKLTALVELLKGKQDLNLKEGNEQNKPKAKTLAERLLVS
jgi:HK97 family phage prohead protease